MVEGGKRREGNHHGKSGVMERKLEERQIEEVGQPSLLLYFHPTILLLVVACLMILYLASHTSTLDEDHHYLAHPFLSPASFLQTM